jgi:transposase
MKKVRQLSEAEILELNLGYKKGPNHPFRVRCQIVLLSNENMSCGQIANALNKNLKTVYNAIESYNSNGYKNLSNKTGQGRISNLDNLTEKQVKYLKEAVDDQPQNLNKVVAKLVKEFGFHISLLLKINYDNIKKANIMCLLKQPSQKKIKHEFARAQSTRNISDI